MKGPLFYSKILLFGEYGIIKDSKGLSIPYNFYNGALKKDKNPNEKAIKSNKNLESFVTYLQSLDPNLVAFDFEKLESDVESGMYFDSSIPQGYGVGSSGALQYINSTPELLSFKPRVCICCSCSAPAATVNASANEPTGSSTSCCNSVSDTANTSGRCFRLTGARAAEIISTAAGFDTLVTSTSSERFLLAWAHSVRS